MSKKLKILFLVTTEHIQVAYEEILDAFNKKNIDVDPIGISFWRWFGERHKLTFEKLSDNFEKYCFSSPPDEIENWWNYDQKDIIIRENHSKILDEINSILEKATPDCLITATDNDFLDSFLIKLSNKKNIPVIFLEHGFGIAAQTFEIFNKSGFINKLKQRLKYDILNLDGFYEDENNPDVFLMPAGMNGAMHICCYSDFSAKQLRYRGIRKKYLHKTGFPYFDRVLKTTDKKKENKKIKILIVSNGEGSLGQKEYAQKFYSEIIDWVETNNGKYELYIRLKPGEIIEEILPKSMVSKFEALNIKFDDNSKPSYISILNYHIVVSTPSTMIFEALINNIPAVLIDDNTTYADYLFKQTLDIACLDISENIDFVMQKALKKDYLEKLRNNMYKNEAYLFHKLDGRCADRIVEVIQKKYWRKNENT